MSLAPADQRDQTSDTERTDLLESLAKHRSFLRYAVQGLTDDQARLHPTVSELSLGGLIKHVARVEGRWADFIVHGPTSVGGADPDAMAAHMASFRMGPDETLQHLLDHYEGTAESTDRLVRELPSLDIAHPLPEAPWFPPGAAWSARRVLLHILAETAQHAGHADILREAIDGQKTMG